MAFGLLDAPGVEALNRYLDVSVGRHALIASNVANKDTPGYRAVDFDFNAEMRRSLKELDRSRRPRSEVAPGLTPFAPDVFEVRGLRTGPDGNNVSLSREAVHLSRNSGVYQIGARLLRQRLDLLRTVIAGGGR